MGRLLKEVRFDEGVVLSFQDQEVTVKVTRSKFSEHSVKLTIEAPTDVLITGTAQINRQEGQKEQ